MVDAESLMYQSLSKLGLKVHYQYPTEFDGFPCVAYTQSGLRKTGYANGVPTLRECEVTIYVFEKEDLVTGNVVEIHDQVEKGIPTDVWMFQGYTNTFQEDTKIIQHIYKYTTIMEEV